MKDSHEQEEHIENSITLEYSVTYKYASLWCFIQLIFLLLDFIILTFKFNPF